MKEIHFPASTSLEYAVKVLLEHKQKGEEVFTEYNSATLYSKDITLDSAFLAVTGGTYAQCLAKREELRQKREKEDKDYKARIPELKKTYAAKGREFIDPSLFDKWDQAVDIRLNDLYEGFDLKSALEIMDALHKGCTLKQAQKIVDKQNHSGNSYMVTISMVYTFSPKGPELWAFLKDNGY